MFRGQFRPLKAFRHHFRPLTDFRRHFRAQTDFRTLLSPTFADLSPTFVFRLSHQKARCESENTSERRKSTAKVRTLVRALRVSEQHLLSLVGIEVSNAGMGYGHTVIRITDTSRRSSSLIEVIEPIKGKRVFAVFRIPVGCESCFRETLTRCQLAM